MPLFRRKPDQAEIEQRCVSAFLSTLHTAAMIAEQNQYPLSVSSEVSQAFLQARAQLLGCQNPDSVASTLAATLVELRTQADRVRQETQQVSQQLVQANQDKRSLQRELDALHQHATTQRVRALEAETTHLQDELSQAQQQLAQKEGDLARSQAAHAHDTQQLHARLSDLNRIVAEQQLQINDLLDEVA